MYQLIVVEVIKLINNNQEVKTIEYRLDVMLVFCDVHNDHIKCYIELNNDNYPHNDDVVVNCLSPEKKQSIGWNITNRSTGIRKVCDIIRLDKMCTRDKKEFGQSCSLGSILSFWWYDLFFFQ